MAGPETAPPGKKRIPVIAKQLRLTNSAGSEGVLIGSRCKDCGVVFFGLRDFCANCTSAHMLPVELSQEGKVASWTIVRAPPSGWKGPAPYALVQVSLPEGPEVTSEAVDLPLENLKTGMKMKLVLRKGGEDKDGNEIMVYKWAPA